MDKQSGEGKQPKKGLLGRLFNPVSKMSAPTRRVAVSGAAALLAASAAAGGVAYFHTASSGGTSLVLKQGKFEDLPGWKDDEHGKVVAAFKKSCDRILKQSPSRKMSPGSFAGTYGDWQPACEALQKVDPANDDEAREFFEKWFVPFLATEGGKASQGLFTGYYEASLDGSRTQGGDYQTALFNRPDDLKQRSGRWGRYVNGKFQKYWTREEISTGKWPHDDEALVYVDDPVDAFFLHIQGSGVVNLPDGTQIRVGYDGQNGHPYYAIGKELVKRGHMKLEDVTMQSIRQWLTDNPKEGMEIMFTDKSFVFFRETGADGAIGAEGVTLTPERSLAVDRKRIPYGIPLFLDAEHPTEDNQRLRKVMVAQDTGGAITGAVRGDFFWGNGAEAEKNAGHMKSKGQYWLLLPKTLGK